MPSPTGSLVTSTVVTEALDALLVAAPLAEVVTAALIAVALAGAALTEVAGDKVTFSLEPHADAITTAATHTA